MQIYNYDLKYDSKPRYAEKITLPVAGGEGIPFTRTVFDEQDSFQLNGNTLFITSGLPFKTDLSLYWVFGVYPKPSLPMGRGLSQLKNPRVVWNGRWATVRGSLTDGTSLVAQVDTQDHFLVRQAKRFGKNGQIIGVTTTAGELCNGLIAEKSSYRSKDSLETVAFTSARFDTPDASLFHFPLRGSLHILDQRLGVGTVVKKSSSGEISKADLLEMTRASLKKRSEAQDNRILGEKVQSAINIFVMMLPILLFGTWFSYAQMKKTKNVS